MFERFTDRSRRVLVLAQEEARLLNHSFIGTEHILLGLIAEGEGVAAKALEQLDVSLEAAEERVEEMIGISGTIPTGSPPFTPRAKKVLELSYRESLQLGHNYIGTEHLLLGLVREGEGVAAQVLVSLGADLASVRQQVLQLLSGYQAGKESGGSRPPVDPRRRLRRGRGTVVSRASGGLLVDCSFCGRQPPETGQLVSGRDAFICEHCIRRWNSVIETAANPNVAAATYHVVEVTGPPPEDQDSARAEIAAAFAEHGTLSDDGEVVPMVEGGENLGPTLRAAGERRQRFIAENPEITTTVDEVIFVDAGHAAVWFTISSEGRSFLHGRRGDAVVVDGTWKMTRATFCELMALAGVQCPPPPS